MAEISKEDVQSVMRVLGYGASETNETNRKFKWVESRLLEGMTVDEIADLLLSGGTGRAPIGGLSPQFPRATEDRAPAPTPPEGGFAPRRDEQVAPRAPAARPAPTGGFAPDIDPLSPLGRARRAAPAAAAAGGGNAGILLDHLSALGFNADEVRFLSDGRAVVFNDFTQDWETYDVVDGQAMLVGLGDPFRADGAGGGAANRFQFLGTNELTGEAEFLDMRTGGQVTGNQIGFPGIDPAREFAATEAERVGTQRLAEADLARQVLSSGGDFLFREAFNRGAIPTTGFVSMEDLLQTAIPGFNAAQAQAVTGAAPTVGAVAGGGRTLPPFTISPGGDQFTVGAAPGGLPSGMGFAPGVEDVNPVQRTGLAQLSREAIPSGPIREILGGPGFVSRSGRAFRTPTPAMFNALTDEQFAASETAALRELGTPLEDIRQESARGFLPPTRRSRGRAVRV